MNTRERILVVRRDNIGDLVLTTPLIRALRAARPTAWIGALVNSYNAPVLAGNSDLDQVFAYDKAKHQPDKSRLSVFSATARLLFALRRQHIDQVILAGPGAQRHAYALARWIKPRSMTGFVTPDFAPAGITSPVPYGDGVHLHEAEDVFRLLASVGATGEIPASAVHADAVLAARWRVRIDAEINRASGAADRSEEVSGTDASGADGTSVDGTSINDEAGRVARAPHLASITPLIAVHISARRAKQRWPASRFAETMRRLHQQCGARFWLLWSPGAADEAGHPGDDAKAREVRAGLPSSFPLVACPTQALPDLIAVLSLADAVLCADGGAMHLAAGLGKPIIALFGDSPVARWRPWQVAHEVVQAPGGDVAQLPVSEVLSAWERLAPRVSAG